MGGLPSAALMANALTENVGSVRATDRQRPRWRLVIHRPQEQGQAPHGAPGASTRPSQEAEGTGNLGTSLVVVSVGRNRRGRAGRLGLCSFRALGHGGCP